MRRAVDLIVFFVLLSLCLSCQHKMKPGDYVKYVTDKENGLKKTTQIDGLEFCMQYRPYDYILLMENRGDMSNDDLIKRISDLRGTAWFTITLKRMDNTITPLRYGIATIEEYNKRLDYYLNEASKDIRLVYGKDTMQPVSYLFENNYNLTPQETMIVGFYLPQGENYPRQTMRLSFFDRIFKTGIINAQYSDEILNNIPKLVY